MKLSKTLITLAFVPFLLTGCAKSITKQEAIDYATTNFTSKEGKKSKTHYYSDSGVYECMPQEFNKEFSSKDEYYDEMVYPTSATKLQDADESIYSFFLDGKNLGFNFTYKDDAIRAYIEKTYEITFPADSITNGTYKGSAVVDEKGYLIKSEEHFNFEIEYKVEGNKFLGKITHTIITNCSY